MGRTRRPPTWPFPSLSSIAIACHAFRTPGLSWAAETVFGRPCHCLLALDSGLRLVGTVSSRR